MKRHRNLPFFVPHAGCPNCCVFCSQVKITGEKCEKELSAELAELRFMLDSAGDGFSESQIAFFGGSFTAIERTRMEALLSTACEYIERGVAESIRISTRPDCINEEIIAILKKYKVRNVELGIQSTDDTVLEASGRGHTAKASFEAAKLLVENGLVFGGQMMIGLPGASPESEMKTARDIVLMGACEARIYPTVVFEGTKLYDMAKNGEYEPLSLDNAVERSAKCFEIFRMSGVKLLRIGLHASENLKNAPMGANHPAIGELVKSRVYADIIAGKAGDCSGKRLCVGVCREDISMLRGHGGKAVELIKAATRAAEIEIKPLDIPRFCPEVKIL